MGEKSRELMDLMIRKGYPEEFAYLIAMEMRTDYTAGRMIGYLAGAGMPRMEDVADEMLAIKSDVDRFAKKHMSEYAQAKINDFYRNRNE